MARKRILSEPTLKDWSEVDEALCDIRECLHALKECQVERDRRIDDVKTDYAQKATPLEDRIKRLENDIKAFVDAHRAELNGKSRRLLFGTVGYRLSSKLILPSAKVPNVITTLKSLGRTELLKISESIDREALKKQPSSLLSQLGAHIQQSDTFYYDVQEEAPAES